MGAGWSVKGGIDEAGRGPVLGPLVVAGVACEDPAILADMGCKDSKRLTPMKRERLARLIEKHPEIRVVVEVLEPEDLDEERRAMSLNDIEVVLFRRVAKALGAGHLTVDAADVDAARFGRNIAAGLDGVAVLSEHKADDNHVIVAAASIIAKTRRDAAIEDLRRSLERRIDFDMGSGYPSDPKTRAFIETWHARFGDVPPGTRRSWKTVQALLGPKQAGLDGFGATTA